ncbi:MAG TPA: CHASE3 domain-containing protein, partial [Tahibacter sp.]|uniref:CHASE3 domain-containing protein n=1 Tax=Tahibacter sp. TaxID=2056211 RepID=UPI002C844AD3
MPDSIAADDQRNLRALGFLPPKAAIGFALALFAVGLIAWFSWQALVNRTTSAARVQRSSSILVGLGDALSAMKDAESGQRGYLISGEGRYLEPFTAAKSDVAAVQQQLQALISGDEEQQRRFDALRQLIAEKFSELEESIRLRQNGDGSAALALFATDRGRVTMDRIRALVREIESAEQRRQDEQQREWREASDRTVWTSIGGGGVLFVLILIAAYVTSRDYRARETEAWVRRGQAGLAERLLGEQGLQSIGENVLGFLTRFLEAPVGAVYVQSGGSRFHAVAVHAVDGGLAMAEQRLGEGLVGQAVKDRALTHLTHLPAGYLPLRSGLVRGDAAEVLILPVSVDGVVQAVVELGFLRPVRAAEKDLLRRAADVLAITVRTARDRARVLELLEETQRQAEELQTQQEELRVSNEELEEQSNALKASRAQMENQQTELEQTNAQLEEFAQQLEHQRDELARSQVVLIDKAAELERANSYKSEFLANMSHELRTPLNSTLILAKLLADNKGGNLNEEQVKFAQTISSAGKDLLAIINDILDLAKIEAGRVEINREKVNIVASTDALVRTFRPVAVDRGLELVCDIQIGTPLEITTDPLRLGQILRNLLSNAIKFTDQGKVELRVCADEQGQIVFAVHDTGIGIAEQQQDVIFEAFRQADGSMHRKYGGTGLGLSISRDLARLLGGDIVVRSTPGKGSIFVLTLPAQAPEGAAAAAP